MSGPDPMLRAVDLLAPAFEASGLDELEVEAGELTVRLSRHAAVPAAPAAIAPDVQEGDEIGVGSVVGLIEAMKLFNEIKSDVGGRVTRTLVESGTLVKRQQPLLEVDPRG
jgi:biotin carboxyl carrier protein